MDNRIYKPLESYSLAQAKNILQTGSFEDLMLLPLSVGEYLDDWAEAQNICLTLITHEAASIRANAALGLSYIARTKGKLDKRLVKPYLLKELRENSEYRWRIVDSINDINIFLKWHLAEKALDKLEVNDT